MSPKQEPKLTRARWSPRQGVSARSKQGYIVRLLYRRKNIALFAPRGNTLLGAPSWPDNPAHCNPLSATPTLFPSTSLEAIGRVRR
eukprot:1193504-Prorocentrum_minimum.AAC.2